MNWLFWVEFLVDGLGVMADGGWEFLASSFAVDLLLSERNGYVFVSLM